MKSLVLRRGAADVDRRARQRGAGRRRAQALDERGGLVALRVARRASTVDQRRRARRARSPGSATAATPGSCSTRRARTADRGRRRRARRRSRPRIWTGPSAPGPAGLRGELEADCAVSKSFGNCASAPVPQLQRQRRARRSAASARSRRCANEQRALHQRAVQRSQNGRGPCACGARRELARPGRRSCPGSYDAAAEQRDQRRQQRDGGEDRDRDDDDRADRHRAHRPSSRSGTGPASATITVTPEKTTAMPEVRIAIVARLVADRARRAAPRGSARG